MNFARRDPVGARTGGCEQGLRNKEHDEEIEISTFNSIHKVTFGFQNEHLFVFLWF